MLTRVGFLAAIVVGALAVGNGIARQQAGSQEQAAKSFVDLLEKGEFAKATKDFDQAMQDVERMCLEQGIYLLNSLNPFRILGQQSLVFELAQQLSWDAPDWIVLPAGNLGNTSALGVGLLRAYQLGLISRLPRIASVQASGANPFYRSYQDSFASFEPVKAATLATAIPVARLFIGDAPDFEIAPLNTPSAVSAPLFLVLGGVAGLLAVAYNRTLLAFIAACDRFARLPIEVRAGLIGASVGILAWFAPELVGGGDQITQRTLDKISSGAPDQARRSVFTLKA